MTADPFDNRCPVCSRPTQGTLRFDSLACELTYASKRQARHQRRPGWLQTVRKWLRLN